MIRFWKALGAGMVLLGALAFGSASARADFQLNVYEDGALIYTQSSPTGLLDTGFQTAKDLQFDVVASNNAPGTPTQASTSTDTIIAKNTSTKAHDFRFLLSANDFNQPSTSTLLVNGTAIATFGAHFDHRVPKGNTKKTDTLSFTAAASNTNTLFAETTTAGPVVLTSSGKVPNSQAGQTGTSSFTNTGTYSLTADSTAHLGGKSTISFRVETDVNPVPEPTSLALLALGVPALFFVRKCRKGKQLA
jgi:hypothetical protein